MSEPVRKREGIIEPVRKRGNQRTCKRERERVKETKSLNQKGREGIGEPVRERERGSRAG